MNLHVLILAARNLTLPEARAVGEALMRANCRVTYLDAHMKTRDARALAQGQQRSCATESSAPGAVQRLKESLLRSGVARMLLLLRGVVADRRQLARVIKTVAPDAVVVYDDRRVRPDLVLRHVAGERGIAVVIVPFAVSSLEADLYGRRENNGCALDRGAGRWLKQFVARRWPGQVAESGDGHGVLFFEPLDTLLLAALGLLPRRPWVLGGSDPEMICALGEDHREYLLAGGVAAAKIAVTGQPSLDAVARLRVSAGELRDRLVKSYRLASGVPLVVCAVPQHGEHRMASWNEHWRATDELFAALASSGAAVLLSLHPKSNREDYAKAAGRHGLAILDEPLSAVLPAADLLVATFSSTVRWAIGIGIPAFVVDAIETNYELYNDLPGVTIFNDHDALARDLRGFVASADIRALHVVAARRGAERVGLCDGGASERVVSAIVAAVSARRSADPAATIFGLERTVT